MYTPPPKKKLVIFFFIMGSERPAKNEHGPILKKEDEGEKCGWTTKTPERKDS